MLVSDKLFGVVSPNGVQGVDSCQNKTEQTKVYTVCTVSPVRNSITRNNRVQKRADFSRGENINNF